MSRSSSRSVRARRTRPSRSSFVLPEALESRRLFAAVAWDGGGDDSNWHDPNNWSTNQVPGPADDVTINVAANPTVVVRVGSIASARSVSAGETLYVYGTLDLAAPSSASRLVQVRGTIRGAGDFTVGTSGVLIIGGGNGTMSGAGRTVVDGRMLVDGSCTVARQLVVNGSCRWDAGVISMNGGTVNNFGTWECGSALNPPTGDLVMRGTGGTNAFNNIGNFRAGPGNTSFVSGAAAMPFNNFRPAHVAEGNFAALGGGTNTSDITIDRADLTLTLGGNQLMQGGSRITGSGRLQLTGGGTIESRAAVSVAAIRSDASDAGFTAGSITANRIEITGGATWFVPDVSFPVGVVSGGRLTSEGNTTFTSSLDWTVGIIGGSGRIVTSAGAQVNISGAANRVLNGRVEVNGNTVWSGGAIEMAGTLTNNGTLRIEPASAAGLTMHDFSLGSGSRFVNNGMLIKRSAPAATLDLSVTQNGDFVVEQGELKLSRGGAHAAGATNRASLGATLALDGSHTFANNGSLNSFLGTLRIDGGTSTYGGSLIGAENLTLAGGTFTLGGAPARTLDFAGGTGVLNGTGTIAGGSLSAGEWRGSGNVTISSNFAWTGGTIGGTGTLTTAAPDSVLQISGPDVHQLARPLVLRGYTNWLGGDINVTETGSIRNDGNFGAMNTSGTVRLFRSGGGAPFVNNGTFAKFFGGAARVDSTFNNAGLVTIPGGSIALAQGGIHGGDFDVALNSSLELGGGQNLNAGSAVTGQGLLRLAGAIVNVAGSQTYDGELLVASSSSLTLQGQRTQVRELTLFGTAAIAPGGSRVLSVRTLDVKPGAMLDIADNAVVVDYTGPSPIAPIRTAIASGYAGGAWNGTGIRSSVASNHAGTAIGYAEASEIFTSFPGTFAGESIDDTCVVVRHALKGDANLDGRVNLADFNRLAGAFGQVNRGWSSGDCNFDETVNLSDFNALAANFGRQLN